MNPGLVKSFTAEVDVLPHRIMSFGTNDYGVTPATSATAKSFGVTGQLGATAGNPIDVVMSDVEWVELGGVVAAGDFITAGAGGVGVLASPAAGANVRVLGHVLIAGVSGDRVPVFINPSMMQG